MLPFESILGYVVIPDLSLIGRRSLLRIAHNWPVAQQKCKLNALHSLPGPFPIDLGNVPHSLKAREGKEERLCPKCNHRKRTTMYARDDMVSGEAANRACRQCD